MIRDNNIIFFPSCVRCSVNIFEKKIPYHAQQCQRSMCVYQLSDMIMLKNFQDNFFLELRISIRDFPCCLIRSRFVSFALVDWLVFLGIPAVKFMRFSIACSSLTLLCSSSLSIIVSLLFVRGTHEITLDVINDFIQNDSLCN